EVNDVVAGDEHIRRIVAAQVLGLLRPAHRGKGPQGRTEPGVQHVGILLKGCASAVGAPFRGLPGNGDFAAVPAVPGRNAVTPPQLSGNAPIPHVLDPVEINLLKPLGYETDSLAAF